MPVTQLPKVIKLFPGYDIIHFPWGSAVKDLKTDQWISAHFPDGQELNLEEWAVELHENGIEIVGFNFKAK